jgi:hypothetical protein
LNSKPPGTPHRCNPHTHRRCKHPEQRKSDSTRNPLAIRLAKLLNGEIGIPVGKTSDGRRIVLVPFMD